MNQRQRVVLSSVTDSALMMTSAMPLLSIIVPVFNEALGLQAFHRRLSRVLEHHAIDAEILYINDGSVDTSMTVLTTLRQHDIRIGVIDLSRRFGKEAAMSAGLDHARGEAVIIIDADLQDPPEAIPEMLAAWRRGFDVVAMKRADRSVDSVFKRLSAKLFYRILDRLSAVTLPRDVGDFRLLSRRAVDALNQLPERNRYMKGLYAWVGFTYIELPYQRAARHAGHSQWSLSRLFGLAFDGITAFSLAPLRLASGVGILTALLALSYGLAIAIKTLFLGDPVAGFPTLMVTMTFLGGVQLIAIGILGEYLGRMFIETKGRPLYLLNTITLPQRGNVAKALSNTA